MRALRRRILTPNVSATSMATRGFHVKNQESRELLERVGRTFLQGYAYAAEARVPADAERGLETVPTRFRGFAYEGAAMAFSVIDTSPLPGKGRFERFLQGRGDAHIYMAYVGVGWAMARLPRFTWRRVVAPDFLLRWLVLDGYGFHQAYFQTDRYVHGQHHENDFPWPAGDFGAYRARAIDQGIGRAMWFVAGTDVDVLISMFEKFPQARRADLFSGAGLAATYAGGATEEELRSFWKQAGPYRPQVAQGSAFAAEARSKAGLIVPHVELATDIFCGMTPTEAAMVNAESLPELIDQPDLPAYEVWRQRIADRFASLGRN
ncbi:DUF1702 family protein [Streptosporangiaceae bacterium NEAU-GS5]|nr:DUF1702 family protein [Streptosporangiaceae bacterium NEAU-GS5]